jgi:capsular exopolysaccharide synthesis family protein
VVRAIPSLHATSDGKEPYEIVGAPSIVGLSYPPLLTKEVGTLTAVRRHWRLIVGLAVVGSVAAYLLCQMLTPLYASSARVMIDPREPKRTAVSTDPTSALAPSEETVRKNEIAIIRSRRLAETVVSDIQLDRNPEFNPALRPPSLLRKAIDYLGRLLSGVTAAIGLAPGTAGKTAEASAEQTLDKAVDLFMNRLATTSSDASRVIDIRFLSENAERAARVANTVAEQYMQHKVKQDLAEAQSAVQALQQEIDALNDKIRGSERAIERTRSENGLLPGSDLKVIAERISELNSQLVTTSAQRAAAQSRLADLEAARASNRLDSLNSVLDSRLIQQLGEQAALVSGQVAEMSAQHAEEYPKLVEARAHLRDVRARLGTEVDKVAATYRSDLAVAQAKETSLRKMVESAKAEANKASASEVEVHVAEREVEANRNLLGMLVAKLDETEAQINRKGPEAQLLSRATVPQRPTFPPKLPIVAVTFLAAVTGGTILAVLLERRDRSIRSTVQLRQMTTARVLGAVPAVKQSWQLRRSPIALVLAEPTSMFAENLRAVWFWIDYSMQAHSKTLVITSALPGEGKTSIATSLARQLALIGRRVVIVDADLRHPRAHRVLGLKQHPGLADLIEGSQRIESVLQRDEPSGAFFVAAGEAVGSPADYLQSPKTSEILSNLSATFDAVIVDTPPVLAVHDAGIMARHAGMTIIVVRWGATRAPTFLTALQRLHDLNVPVGVILSMVDPKKYGQFDYLDGEAFGRSLRSYYSN